jgi:hypothetical protein
MSQEFQVFAPNLVFTRIECQAYMVQNFDQMSPGPPVFGGVSRHDANVIDIHTTITLRAGSALSAAVQDEISVVISIVVQKIIFLQILGCKIRGVDSAMFVQSCMNEITKR